MEEGEEHPTAFASRTLTKTETNYAQNRKGGAGNCVRCTNVSQVFVRLKIHVVERSRL